MGATILLDDFTSENGATWFLPSSHEMPTPPDEDFFYKNAKRVIAKAYPGSPHEILLVIDANTGQNTVSQVKAFDDALGVTGLVLTKLDGTAKGGVIAAIAEARPIPIRFIGIGEAIDDLRPFSAQDFVDALFDE